MKSLPRPPPPELDTENRLLPVEPRPLDPIVEFDEPDLELLDELDLLALARSLNRFVLPRMAPKLDAPAPIVALVAVLVEVDEPSAPEEESVEFVEVDELEDVEEEEELLLEDPPELETTAEPPPPPLRLDPPVPRPDRLPRSCGAIMAANRSALMVPESLTVRETVPVATVAVGVVVTGPPPPPPRNTVSLAMNSPAPATTTVASTPQAA